MIVSYSIILCSCIPRSLHAYSNIKEINKIHIRKLQQFRRQSLLVFPRNTDCERRFCNPLAYNNNFQPEGLKRREKGPSTHWNPEWKMALRRIVEKVIWVRETIFHFTVCRTEPRCGFSRLGHVLSKSFSIIRKLRITIRKGTLSPCRATGFISTCSSWGLGQTLQDVCRRSIRWGSDHSWPTLRSNEIVSLLESSSESPYTFRICK